MATKLLQQAQQRLTHLTPERLRVANDFLAYLEDREADEATEELLAIPGFLAEFEEAEQEIEQGLLVPFDELRQRS